LCRTAPLVGLKAAFRRQVVADAGIYFCAPDDVVNAALGEEARRRYKIAPDGQTLTWKDLSRGLNKVLWTFREDAQSNFVGIRIR
jgi:hypothetical protein